MSLGKVFSEEREKGIQLFLGCPIVLYCGPDSNIKRGRESDWFLSNLRFAEGKSCRGQHFRRGGTSTARFTEPRMLRTHPAAPSAAGEGGGRGGRGCRPTSAAVRPLAATHPPTPLPHPLISARRVIDTESIIRAARYPGDTFRSVIRSASTRRKLRACAPSRPISARGAETKGHGGALRAPRTAGAQRL
jgi:hypothetical protein